MCLKLNALFYATFWCRKNEQTLYATDPSQDQAGGFEHIMVYPITHFKSKYNKH